MKIIGVTDKGCIVEMDDLELARTCGFETSAAFEAYLEKNVLAAPGEFLFVDDCVEGLLLAADRYDEPEPVNLGTGVETTIRELAELVAELTGFAGELVWDTSMPNGQPRRQLDATRAAERFGFHASTSLREGLERTIAWYRENALARS